MTSHLLLEKLGGRKFVVAMFALGTGTLLGLTCNPAVVTAYAGLAAAVVVSFNGAHAVADWKGRAPPP